MSAEHTILALTHRSHEVAKNSGFVENGKVHPYYRDVNLFLSETAEALEDYRDGHGLTEVYYMHKEGGVSVRVPHEGLSREERSKLKPCGIPSELADVVIRICQRCGTEGSGARLQESFDAISCEEDERNFEQFLAHINLVIAKSYEAAARGKHFDDERIGHLAYVLWSLFDFASQNGIDLWAAIDEKEAYNRTRSFRHGGKRL